MLVFHPGQGVAKLDVGGSGVNWQVAGIAERRIARYREAGEPGEDRVAGGAWYPEIPTVIVALMHTQLAIDPMRETRASLVDQGRTKHTGIAQAHQGRRRRDGVSKGAQGAPAEWAQSTDIVSQKAVRKVIF